MKNVPQPTTSKKYYTPPMISAIVVNIEYSIAAGSATVTPVNSTNQVRDEWEEGTNVAGSQTW